MSTIYSSMNLGVVHIGTQVLKSGVLSWEPLEMLEVGCLQLMIRNRQMDGWMDEEWDLQLGAPQDAGN
eukprot:1160602-Pelagomonas_calceolata.AAC.3